MAAAQDCLRLGLESLVEIAFPFLSTASVLDEPLVGAERVWSTAIEEYFERHRRSLNETPNKVC